MSSREAVCGCIPALLICSGTCVGGRGTRVCSCMVVSQSAVLGQGTLVSKLIITEQP